MRFCPHAYPGTVSAFQHLQIFQIPGTKGWDRNNVIGGSVSSWVTVSSSLAFCPLPKRRQHMAFLCEFCVNQWHSLRTNQHFFLLCVWYTLSWMVFISVVWQRSSFASGSRRSSCVECDHEKTPEIDLRQEIQAEQIFLLISDVSKIDRSTDCENVSRFRCPRELCSGNNLWPICCPESETQCMNILTPTRPMLLGSNCWIFEGDLDGLNIYSVHWGLRVGHSCHIRIHAFFITCHTHNEWVTEKNALW